MKHFLKFILIICITISCNEEDNIVDSDNTKGIYEEAIKSATIEKIQGRWAIFEVEFENKITEAPISIQECGRDFFNFLPNQKYIEYIFDNSNCTPQINNLKWTLSEGVITFTNGIEEKEEWIITELNSEKMIVRYQTDIDEDGTIEVFKFNCKPYIPPIEMDVYTQSFQWEYFVGTNDKILFTWDKYEGYNDFIKYEIYRSNEINNSTKQELISTITSASENSFTDLSPSATEKLYYQLKIYTDKGLLGESSIVTVTPSRIIVPLVSLKTPTLNNTTVNLKWEKFDGYYFSHYLIEVRNYSSGSGAGYQEEIVAKIEDVDITNLSLELPYFNNPVFVINAYNIFGTPNGSTIETINQRSTNFTRSEILPIDRIKFSEISDNETIIYLSDYSYLYRYNYTTNTIEKQVQINSSSIVFMKKISSIYGTEIIINVGGSLKVYDTNLNLKYELEIEKPNFTFRTEHAVVNENGYWLITDREKLYSFTRTDNTLNFINSVELYEGFSSSRINIADLKQNKILVGNYLKENSFIVNINNEGILEQSILPINLKTTSPWKNDGIFSEENKYFLNIEDNSLYSTDSYNLITKLNSEFFTSSIGNNGSLIIGTNNTPIPKQDSFHERKIRTINYPSLQEKEYETKGYPSIIYQNHLKQLVSISKGLIGNISGGSPEGEIFIEVIDIND